MDSTTLRKACCLALGLLTISLSACSPFYVIRAGWEEAGILFKRQDINEILDKEKDLDQKTKNLLALVLDARKFANDLGLSPGESFSTYSKVDRDVLVWVLSASPKNQLAPVTWWFPIVGRIPYKGFFEKQDAVKEGALLSKKGYDIFIRPSIAYSTLGWFNDPLLSTYLKLDEIQIANTVIHEIVHNTIWIPNHASFNETLANIIGALGAIEFFHARNDKEKELAAKNRLHEEILFANFIEKTIVKLKEFYKAHPEINEDFLKQREEMLKTAQDDWLAERATLKSNEYSQRGLILNNAAIIAQQIYLDRSALILDAYKRCSSLNEFIMLLKKNSVLLKKSSDPFKTLLEISPKTALNH